MSSDVTFNSEELKELLNLWYMNIKLKKVEAAEKLRMEVTEQLEKTTSSKKMHLLAKLIKVRHYILHGDYTEANYLLDKLDFDPDLTEELKYYFHLFKGIYLYETKNFSEAVGEYETAEKYLDFIHDDIERADYHQKVASALYYLDSTFKSALHSDKAVAILKNYPAYEIQLAKSEITLALNYIDMKEFDEAEELLHSASQKAITTEIMNSVNHNLGLLYKERKMPQTAIRYYEKVMEHSDFHFIIPVIYQLTECFYEIHEIEKANSLCQQGLEQATYNRDKEYISKFNTLYSQYFDKLNYEKNLLNAFEYFNSLNHYSTPLYAKLLGIYYNEERDFEKSSSFFKKALEIQNN